MLQNNVSIHEKNAIFTLNNQKFFGEGHGPCPNTTPGANGDTPTRTLSAPRSSDHIGNFSLSLQALPISAFPLSNLIVTPCGF